MADSSIGPANFCTQANALLRKNLTFQKRNKCTNIRLVSFPIVLCLLIAATQIAMDRFMKEKDPSVKKCDHQAGNCPAPTPLEWTPMLQIPAPENRAVRTNFVPFSDLPDESCRRNGSCPVTLLLTGNNHSLGESLSQNMFTSNFNVSSLDAIHGLASNVIGSDVPLNNFPDTASFPSTIYLLQSQCTPNISRSIWLPSINASTVLRSIQGLNLWRNSSSQINDELYKGYHNGNPEGKINEIVAAYDFLSSDVKHFKVSIWCNSTFKDEKGDGHVPRSINLASNAYLQFLQGPGTQLLFEFVKEIPIRNTQTTPDVASLLGTLFFVWVVLQLFPVVVASLVYEKQQKLRIMMKMNGLGDGPYWVISYSYFLTISSLYMLCFVVFGSAIGLKFFTFNSYSIQFVFYFIYINLQISLAILVAAMFSNVKTASVIGYIFVFGSGLLGSFLFQGFVEDSSFPRFWILVMELYPGFALYRGMYEFGQYSSRGNYFKIDGMCWTDLTDRRNGMREVLIIMFVEWLVVLFVAYYINQIVSSGGVKGPLYLLQKFSKKSPSLGGTSLNRQGSRTFVQTHKPDVVQEREKVEQLLLEPSTSHMIICDDIRKIYPGRDGNPEKIAVRGLSLALPPGECFGMLGPNGAGKTSFISMMIGLTKPTSGTAFVQGLDIRTDMDRIHTSMGVCPQHDLLWETLTGREHLLFYGRLKNLKGSALTQAVEESLKSVNLFYGGVADKQACKYSGGMKRRLSVAISLIGDPKVVYMDEPSTGLDPASRNNLWKVVKRAKQGRAIILTTHSMEEAEALCDRLGIFVDGSLQCIGNPKELRARYGGSYVFSMTTSAANEKEVENMVRQLSPNANKIYQISGTQKFELPKHEVRIADVFQAVENAKNMFAVFAWGLADTTLEDVFIKVARTAEAFSTLS